MIELFRRSVRERLRSAPTTPLMLVCIFCGWPHRRPHGPVVHVRLSDLAQHFARQHGLVVVS